MIERELKKTIQSKDCSPEDYLVLVKMLCAKKGMTLKVWEEIFHEKELKQGLRQRGVPEDIVIDIVACSICALLEGSSNLDASEEGTELGHLLNFNRQRKLTCAICPHEPYKAYVIKASHITGKIEEVFVTVVCKDHFQRLENHDVNLMEAIVDTVRQHKL